MLKADEVLFLNAMVAANKQKMKMSLYDQEMPQSQTTDQPTAPPGRETEHRQPRHK